MISVENLSKSFGSIKAVDDLSFTTQKGEVVGLLGPNGAGKTTTMRLMTGFLSPDSGVVRIGDISVEESTSEAQRSIGYLPENNPLYQDMLVAEFLSLSADLKNIPAAKKRSALDFVVRAVAINEVFYRPISELSKGFQQRVGIASALLHKPPVLIMDEPTEGLDPNQRSEIRTLIKKLAKNHTIIMSTHVMQEAQAVCSRMIIINKGRLVAEGTSRELSRLAQRERVLIIEVEGDGVESSLRSLGGVEHVDICKKKNGRVEAKLMTTRSVDLQPEIAKITHKRRWIIWKLAEQEHKLEDVFHKLTSES